MKIETHGRYIGLTLQDQSVTLILDRYETTPATLEAAVSFVLEAGITQSPLDQVRRQVAQLFRNARETGG